MFWVGIAWKSSSLSCVTGLNSALSFSETGCHTKVKEPVCPNVLAIARGREELDSYFLPGVCVYLPRLKSTDYPTINPLNSCLSQGHEIEVKLKYLGLNARRRFHFLRPLHQTIPQNNKGNPRSVVASILDCDIIVSEFELQSCNYFHFRIWTLGKAMISFIYPAMD